MKRKIITLLLVTAFCFGGVRLYFFLTDGFRVGNITYDLVHNPNFDPRPLEEKEFEKFKSLLDQPFYYLGKGCQSYAFVSADDQYVIKFFKFQHFRKRWFDYFTFIPSLKMKREKKWINKQNNLAKLFTRWKTAYENFREETELLYIHFNPTSHLGTHLTLIDKIGITRSIDLDQIAFLVQKKALMLCPAIEEMMQKGKSDAAKDLIEQLYALMLSDYARGYFDTDFALMQNTGVVEGKPIHIDVGLFEFDEKMKEPAAFKDNLCQRMDKFGQWLERSYPELFSVQQNQLKELTSF